MNLPSKEIMQAGMRQLNVKWMGRNGITKVTLQTDQHGMPSYHFIGPAAQQPAGLPAWMIVPGEGNRPFKIPVFYRQDIASPVNQPVPSDKPELFNSKANAKLPLDPLSDEDVDRAYWFFATPADLNRSVKNYLPAFHAIPEPTNMAPPPADEINTQFHVDMRLPQYDNENFWSKPFEPGGCLCCTWYMRPTLLLNYQVPDTYLAVVNGISYDIQTVLPVGTVFQVDILRGGSVMASFEEIVVDPANPNPSLRVAFASHTHPTPLFVLIDRGQTLGVQITVKGPFPFTKTVQDTFCGTICVLLHGWMASLMDNRDGAPRPSDVGEMREGVGNETVPDINAADVRELLTWIGAVTGSK